MGSECFDCELFSFFIEKLFFSFSLLEARRWLHHRFGFGIVVRYDPIVFLAPRDKKSFLCRFYDFAAREKKNKKKLKSKTTMMTTMGQDRNRCHEVNSTQICG